MCVLLLLLFVGFLGVGECQASGNRIVLASLTIYYLALVELVHNSATVL